MLILCFVNFTSFAICCCVQQSTIAQITKKTGTGEICNFFKTGKKIEEIDKAVVRAGYEKKYKQNSVSERLSKFADLQKLIKLLFQDGKGKSISEIAKQVEDSGLEQSYTGRAVNLRLEEEFSKLKKLLIPQFESKKPIPDIVRENEKYYGLDETLVWAIVLQGKTDIERLHMLGWTQQQIAKEVEQKINLLFVPNHQFLFDSYPQIAKAKGVAQNTVSWRLQLHDDG